MKLAIWNYPPAELLASGFTSGRAASPVTIERADPITCVNWLREGRVDVAMVPTMTLLREAAAFQVAPAVAFSSWNYPFARLVLKHGLEQPISRVAFDPRYVQEVLLTRILLAEHYASRPTFVPYEQPTIDQLLSGPEDAAMVVGRGLEFLRAEGVVLDLGQEWYELANYPMVWAMFAGRAGELEPEAVKILRKGIRTADRQRALWLQAQDTSPELHQFYRDGVRVWLDDLALASITELSHLLFYYKVLDEVPELKFVSVDEDRSGSTEPEEGNL